MRGVTTRARIIDRAGKYLIAVGGISIIVAVLGIFVFILGEVYPLFQEFELVAAGRQQIGNEGKWLAVGVDPYQEVAYAVGANGVDFIRLQTGEVVQAERPEELAGAHIVSASGSGSGEFLALGLDDGRALITRVDFQLDYAEDQRRIRPVFIVNDALFLDTQGEAIEQVAFSVDSEGHSALAGITSSGRLLVAVRQRQQALLGPGRLEQKIYNLSDDVQGRPGKILIDGQVRHLLVGTDTGRICEWKLGDVDDEPSSKGAFAASPDGAAITALSFVLGDVSVAVGDENGRISTWFKVQEGEKRRFRQIHALQKHRAAVLHIASSQRDKQLLSADDAGVVTLHHMTSEQTFFQVQTGIEKIAALCFAPKADGFLILGRGGDLEHYRLDNSHPDVSATVLFGKVWYEGYPEPGYVWQSTGGTDEFEPKISLVPLVFGTVKGTLYAMLFALPLGILAAIYTAEFASPEVRNLVKPTVEVMASLPSVILGFLAGLWLAPILESRMVGTLLLFPLVPATVLVAAWGWHQLPENFARRVSYRGEIYLLVMVSLVAVCLAYALGPSLEGMAFEGHFQNWLTQKGDLHYDQRNCLVVGFAIGFAVIPLIFTISEDALSSVPRHLRAGSLALGATRWQTAIRVVLPMAVPGIFSAGMIGFGRAIGETMIVLMATGNTPIMDWNIFNGMRTIAANIAVELPEAPHHDSLYRVLFLSGLLLFMVTFFINTLAEVVRQRLRKKYNQL